MVEFSLEAERGGKVPRLYTRPAAGWVTPRNPGGSQGSGGQGIRATTGAKHSPPWPDNSLPLLRAPDNLAAMSLAEIQAELNNLTPEELRHLAVESWRAFVRKEGLPEGQHFCDEDDPALLTALDQAAEQADRASEPGPSGDEIRARIAEWSSR